jgi:hypothetical protein
MTSESLHAPLERLSIETLSHHQAIVSLREELEAVDWYRQRADDCDDPALKEILLHNMREEMEHACMVLEWLRRNHPEWQKQLSTYLFTQAPITGIEEQETGTVDTVPATGVAASAAAAASASAGRFTVGPLKD